MRRKTLALSLLAATSAFATPGSGDLWEVTEQDAAVQLLRTNDPLLAGPNRITARDFDGWRWCSVCCR